MQYSSTATQIGAASITIKLGQHFSFVTETENDNFFYEGTRLLLLKLAT